MQADTAAARGIAPRDADEAIRRLGEARGGAPVAAMRWALDHWDEAAPRFVALIDAWATGADRSGPTAQALFFILHLCGEKREQRAFEPLCRVMEGPDILDRILGDTVGTLSGIFISTYGGDPAPLRRVIEMPSADECVRASALDALAYLARAGAFPDAEMRPYLRHLRWNMRPQGSSFVWTAWVLAVANLGYDEYVRDVMALFRRRFVHPMYMKPEDFEEQRALTLADPTGWAGFRRDGTGPFMDAIGALSDWEHVPDEADVGAPEPLLPSWPSEPRANPHRHVGRNDPCPCGSGKKYKKCCLR